MVKNRLKHTSKNKVTQHDVFNTNKEQTKEKKQKIQEKVSLATKAALVASVVVPSMQGLGEVSQVAAASVENPNDYTVQLNSDGTYTITKYTGSALDISIPAEINGKRVTAIGANAFKDKPLTAVVIPHNIVTIGDYAFANTALTTVRIPDSVEKIGDYAFKCNTLTSVSFGSSGAGGSLKTIGDYAFYSNKELVTAVPMSVETLGTNVFNSNASLFPGPFDVTFSQNGTNTRMKKTSTIVNYMRDSVGTGNFVLESIKYIWSTSSTIPSDSSSWKSISNGATIETPDNATGTYYLHVKVTENNQGNKLYYTETSKVFELGNTSPTATTIPSQTVSGVNKSKKLDVSQYFSDVDGDTLTYSVTPTSNEFVTASMSGSTLTLTGKKKGSTTVTIKASDGNGGTVSKTVSVTVSNTKPTATTIASQTVSGVNKSKTLNLSTYFSDVDSDTLTYSVTPTSNEFITAGVSGSTLTLTGKKRGTTTVTVTANDGNGGTVSKTVSVTVSNTKPTATTIPAQTVSGVNKSKKLDVSQYFSDVDSDTLTYSVTPTSNEFVTASLSGSTLTLTSKKKGSTTVTVTANDGNGGTVSKTVSVTVSNTKPTATTIPAQTVNGINKSKTLDVSQYFSDVDGDALTYTATSSATGTATVSVNGSTLTFSGKKRGTTNVTVTANDGNGGTVSKEVSVTVSNTKPTATTIPAQTVSAINKSATLNVAQYFSDVDGDSLTYSVTPASNEFIKTSMSGSTLTLTGKKKGSTTVTVTANDGNGGTVSKTVSVNINNSTPTTPVLTVPNTQFEHGDKHVINWTASDVDNDTLTYTLEASYNDGTSWEPIYTGSNSIFEYTIPNNKGTKVQFRVKANDGTATSTSTVSTEKSIREVMYYWEQYENIQEDGTDKKGSLVRNDIMGSIDSYEENKKNDDEYWYVRGQRVLAEDTTPPIIELTEQSNYATTSTVTVETYDLGTVQTVKWAKGSQDVDYFDSNGTTIQTGQNAESSFTVTENGTYTVYAKDNAGNKIVKTINVTKVNTRPEVSNVSVPSRVQIVDANTQVTASLLITDVDTRNVLSARFKKGNAILSEVEVTATVGNKNATLTVNGDSVDVFSDGVQDGFSVTGWDGYEESTSKPLDLIVVKVDNAEEYTRLLEGYDADYQTWTKEQHEKFYTMYVALNKFEQDKTNVDLLALDNSIYALTGVSKTVSTTPTNNTEVDEWSTYHQDFLASIKDVPSSETMKEIIERRGNIKYSELITPISTTFISSLTKTGRAIEELNNSWYTKVYDLTETLSGTLVGEHNKKEELQQQLIPVGEYHELNKDLREIESQLTLIPFEKITELEEEISEVINEAYRNNLSERLKEVIKEYHKEQVDNMENELSTNYTDSIKALIQQAYKTHNLAELQNILVSIDEKIQLLKERIESEQGLTVEEFNKHSDLLTEIVTEQTNLTTLKDILSSIEEVEKASLSTTDSVQLQEFIDTTTTDIDTLELDLGIVSDELNTDKQLFKELLQNRLNVLQEVQMAYQRVEDVITSKDKSRVETARLAINALTVDKLTPKTAEHNLLHMKEYLSNSLNSVDKLIDVMNGLEVLEDDVFNTLIKDDVLQENADTSSLNGQITSLEELVESLQPQELQAQYKVAINEVVHKLNVYNQLKALANDVAGVEPEHIDNVRVLIGQVSKDTSKTQTTLIKDGFTQLADDIEDQMHNHKLDKLEEALQKVLDTVYEGKPIDNSVYQSLVDKLGLVDGTQYNKTQAEELVEEIDRLYPIVDSVIQVEENAKTSITPDLQNELNVVKDTLNTIVTSAEKEQQRELKDLLYDRLDKVQEKINIYNELLVLEQVIIDASEEGTLTTDNMITQDQITTLNDKVNDLEDSEFKNTLSERLGELQDKLDAFNGVNKAENDVTQESINEALDLLNDVNSSPESFKGILYDRLDEVQDKVNVNDALKDILDNVDVLDSSKLQEKLDNLQQLIDKLEDSSFKDEKQEQLDNLQADLDTYKELENDVASKVSKLEEDVKKKEVDLEGLNSAITPVQDSVDKLKDNDFKEELQERLDNILLYLQDYASLVAKAEQAVQEAERVAEEREFNLATNTVNILEDGVDKTNLFSRLDVVSLYITAEDLVKQAENLLTQDSVYTAQESITNLNPDHTKTKELTERIGYVQYAINSIKAVETVEKTLSRKDLTTAQELVKGLQDGELKTSLNERLRLVLLKIEANEKAEADRLAKEEADRLAKEEADRLAKEEADRLAEEERKKQEELEKQYDKVEGLIDKAEETKADTDINNAQTELDKLPDGNRKDELQDRLDAIKDAVKENQSDTQKHPDKNEEEKIKDILDKLKDDPTKEDIKAVIDELQDVLTDETIKDILDRIKDIIGDGSKDLTQKDLDEIKDLIEQLPDGIIKDTLNDWLAKEQERLNQKEAEKAVEKAEKTKDKQDISDAQSLIDKVKDKDIKNELQVRLDKVKGSIKDIPKTNEMLQKEIIDKIINGNKVTLDDFSKVGVTLTEDMLSKLLDRLKDYINKNGNDSLTWSVILDTISKLNEEKAFEDKYLALLDKNPLVPKDLQDVGFAVTTQLDADYVRGRLDNLLATKEKSTITSKEVIDVIEKAIEQLNYWKQLTKEIVELALNGQVSKSKMQALGVNDINSLDLQVFIDEVSSLVTLSSVSAVTYWDLLVIIDKAERAKRSVNIVNNAVFSDTEGHWAEGDINRLASLGITTGSDGLFSPNAEITRSQYAVILARALNLTSDADPQFYDIEGEWYQNYVQALYEVGITTGVTPEVFNPNGTITRQQSMAMLGRLLSYSEYEIDQLEDLIFADSDKIHDYAVEEIQKLQTIDVVSGEPQADGTYLLKPTNNLTRAQMAKIVSHVLQVTGY